jgi:hypothetical protein
VTGNKNRRHAWIANFKGLQKLDPIHTWHPDIGNDQTNIRVAGHHFKPVQAICG